MEFTHMFFYYKIVYRCLAAHKPTKYWGQLNNVRKVVSALWREPGSIYEFFLNLSCMGYYSNTQLPAVSGMSVTILA